MKQIIDNKVFYSFVDKTCKFSSHFYKTNDEISADEVEKNVNNIEVFFSVDKLVLLNQVHGEDVYVLDKNNLNTALQRNFRATADAVVTNLKNIALGIQTADCVPVLISSLDGDVIAALHCGWKSSISNMISNVMSSMKRLSPDTRYKAVIGPCILQNSYEVDENLLAKFLQESTNNDRFFAKKDDLLNYDSGTIRSNIADDKKYNFNLHAYVENKLMSYGVTDILSLNEDTYSNKEKYFSYRRNFHQSVNEDKRILSIILMR